MIEKIECSAGLRAGKYSHKNYLKVNIYYFEIIPFRAGKSYDLVIKDKHYMRI